MSKLYGDKFELLTERPDIVAELDYRVYIIEKQASEIENLKLTIEDLEARLFLFRV